MSLLNILEKSRNVIIEMLELRDFDVSKYKNFSIDELTVMLKNNTKINEINPLDMECKHNTKEKKICIKYILSSKIRISNLKSLIDEIIQNEIIDDYDDLILIIKDKCNNISFINNLIDLYLKNHNIFIQIYNIGNLTINITKHSFVPKLKILNKTDTEEIIQKYNVTKLNKFPIFSRNDIQAKFYGVRSGDLCEIIRKSETAGFFNTYRYMP
jgi:DNA-directed RNA polymerase subunit H